MNSLMLPWTMRGLKHDSWTYLTSVSLEPRKTTPEERDLYLIYPEMLMKVALPLLVKLRGSVGQFIEYGCFELDGTLIPDPGLRIKRQGRNILYYMIRDLANLSRGLDRFNAGMTIGLVNDPVPASPEGNWAVLFSTECPNQAKMISALQPLIDVRSGQLIELPKLDPSAFQDWIVEQFNNRLLPPYLLICDSFKNIPLEYQFILNAFAVTGRLWFEEPGAYGTYAQKVLAVERGKSKLGSRAIVASPVDDDVTFADNKSVISPMLETKAAQSIELKPLRGTELTKESLLEYGQNTCFLALYCHGIGLRTDELAEKQHLQGAFVLKYGSRENDGLLTPDDVMKNPFVPGGIIFSPVCLAGGTQQDSDFAAWLDPQGLSPYLGDRSEMSGISKALLVSPRGPIAVLAHFDISIASNAPMYNPMTKRHDLQREIHVRFLGSAPNVLVMICK